MLNPIKRLYKPNVPSRIVCLSIDSESQKAEGAVCEVIEYDSVVGMAQWEDSLFVQDFEDSVINTPM